MSPLFHNILSFFGKGMCFLWRWFQVCPDKVLVQSPVQLSGPAGSGQQSEFYQWLQNRILAFKRLFLSEVLVKSRPSFFSLNFFVEQRTWDGLQQTVSCSMWGRADAIDTHHQQEPESAPLHKGCVGVCSCVLPHRWLSCHRLFHPQQRSVGPGVSATKIPPHRLHQLPQQLWDPERTSLQNTKHLRKH